MDPNNTTPIDQTSETSEKPQSSTGALIGTLVIIILLAIGAFYFWGARLNEDGSEPPSYIPGQQGANTDSDETAGLPPQSDSDEADDIYADVQSMNIDQMGAANANSSESFEASATQ